MFHKHIKLVTGICTAVVVMTATSVVAEAGTLGLPAVGASPDLEVASITEQSNTATALKVSTKTPATDNNAGAALAVGEASNDIYTTVHTEKMPQTENLVSVEGSVEDTVLVVPEEETVSQNNVEDFSNLVIAQVNDYVNVRSIPSEEGEILGKLYDDSVGEFVSEQDGWYEIKSGSVQGFVKGEYVVTGDAAVELAKEVGKRIATVTTTTLFVREEPTTESPVIGMVPIEDELSVTEEGVNDGWVKVSVEEGEGYVSTEFVTLSTEFVKAESKAEEERRLAAEEAERKKANAAVSNSAASKSGASVGSGSGAGSSVAGYALQFVGNPYVYGGSSLTNGTDCSGFVMSVYAHFGVGLPHSSGAQRGCGYDVGGLGNAQPGDIVCYSGHVGIYIGNGQIVHASTAATGIKVSNANYRQVLSVRRIF